MTIIQGQPIIQGPQDDFNKAIDQWKKANEQYYFDYNMLLQMIGEMLAMAKSGKVQEAFQIAQMVVMPGAMQLKGDSMAQLAATMNIVAALQEFTTEAQNLLNTGGKMTIDQAKAFVKCLQDFYKLVTDPKNSDWLDSNTKDNLLKAINKISGTFPGNNGDPNTLDPDKVAQYINAWVNNPTQHWHPFWRSDPLPKTGQQYLQDLQTGFTQWNNTESAQSQVLQSQVQFASNVFTQFMNTCMNMLKSAQEQSKSMVQNQRSS